MNVTSPINSQATHTTSHTLPVKPGTATPAVDNGTQSTKTPQSNPAHLGNHIDTTA